MMQTEWQTVQTQIRLLWVCTVCPGISVRKLRIITVVNSHSKEQAGQTIFTKAEVKCVFQVTWNFQIGTVGRILFLIFCVKYFCMRMIGKQY